MPDYSASREEYIAGFGRLFAWSGGGLLMIFLAVALVDALPFQLLNPAWQLRFTNRMISTSLIALLGFVLLHLAVFVEPSNGFLRSRLVTARQWALVVVVAFLLLVPLQGFATWRVLGQAKAAQAVQRNGLVERVRLIRSSIDAATSPEDLQARFSRFQGSRPQLPPAALALPLPELKRNLLSELQRTEARAAERITGPAPAELWSLTQGVARVTIASLGYAVAFAAGAQKPGASQTLLQIVGQRVAMVQGRRPKGKRGNG